jgi:hypothetical protein
MQRVQIGLVGAIAKPTCVRRLLSDFWFEWFSGFPLRGFAGTPPPLRELPLVRRRAKGGATIYVPSTSAAEFKDRNRLFFFRQCYEENSIKAVAIATTNPRAIRRYDPRPLGDMR